MWGGGGGGEGGRRGEREREGGEEVNQEGRRGRRERGGSKMRCNVHRTGVRTNLSFELCVAAGNQLCQMSYGSRIHHCLG